MPDWSETRLCRFLPGLFQPGLDDAARRITPRTEAIMPVHLFRQTSEMDRIMKLAEAHHIAVIEDAAQAPGAISWP
jgi:dTDP-4-amino-4,6-dideoxygalactose transaminase